VLAEESIGQGMVGPSSMAYFVPSSKGHVAASFQVLFAWLAPWPRMAGSSMEVASRAIVSGIMLLWSCSLGLLQPNSHHNKG
jgi:hypothetical protein